MNTSTRLIARLTAAVSAAATCLVLFSAVVSIAEPQHSVLMAKTQHPQQLTGAPMTLTIAMASASHASGRSVK